MDIFIDANALTLLVLGTVNQRNIGRHSRLSVYSKEEYDAVARLVSPETRLISIPHVWTEVDNLCNRVSGEDRFKYKLVIEKLVSDSFEKYVETRSALQFDLFHILGLTDSIVLEISKECDLLVTGDSSLADRARANDINVLDLKALVNQRLNLV